MNLLQCLSLWSVFFSSSLVKDVFHVNPCRSRLCLGYSTILTNEMGLAFFSVTQRFPIGLNKVTWVPGKAYECLPRAFGNTKKGTKFYEILSAYQCRMENKCGWYWRGGHKSARPFLCVKSRGQDHVPHGLAWCPHCISDMACSIQIYSQFTDKLLCRNILLGIDHRPVS